MPLAVAQAEYNISYPYYLRGRYGQAIQMLRASRKFSEKIHLAHSSLPALAQTHLVNASPEPARWWRNGRSSLAGLCLCIVLSEGGFPSTGDLDPLLVW